MITANKLGYWSAILTALLAALFIGLGLFGSAYTPSLQYPYIVSTVKPIDDAIWIPGLLLAPTFIVLMACLYNQAPIDKKVFGLIGLSFALLYASFIISDYFLQLTAVLPSVLGNETGDLSMFTMYNPHGVFIAQESLGYLMLNTALLTVAPLFAGDGKRERTLRWLFIISFVVAVISLIAILLAGYPIVIFEVVIITVDTIVLIVSGILLRKEFQPA